MQHGAPSCASVKYKRRSIASRAPLTRFLCFLAFVCVLFVCFTHTGKDDSAAYKKPTRIAAPVYIDLMMSEIDSQITDENIFPVEESQFSPILDTSAPTTVTHIRIMLASCARAYACLSPTAFVCSLCSLLLCCVCPDVKFPRNYLSVVKSIYKRLFRLYAHIYCGHIDRIRSIGASAHLNTTFKHLVYFILEHDLVSKTEMQPLERLIAKFTTPEGGIPSASSSSSSSSSSGGK